MPTDAQMNANRENAKKSTGPRTAEGKARVHLNALKHGRRAQLVVLPWEDQQDFDDLCDQYEADYRPATIGEQAMLEDAVVNYWKAMHLDAGERDIHVNCSPEQQKRAMDDLKKDQTRLINAYHRALAGLLKLQSHRLKMEKYERSLNPQPVAEAPQPDPPPPPANASEAGKVKVNPPPPAPRTPPP